MLTETGMEFTPIVDEDDDDDDDEEEEEDEEDEEDDDDDDELRYHLHVSQGCLRVSVISGQIIFF